MVPSREGALGLGHRPLSRPWSLVVIEEDTLLGPDAEALEAEADR